MSDAVRTKMNLPTESSRRASASDRREVGPTDPPEDRARRTARPCTVCAIAVPQAEPSIPQSRP